ncbi:MAG TPA: LysM peptidoglycan-binding domain-containing protein [Planctomycetes bacterium]|nr:LysM peptidoglycan-binding domain-containing protein [Planctomycetota bacterium]
MGQVEKIFVVSIVGLVLLILAITVFGPSHQGAQACIVPAETRKAGVENPLHPEGLDQAQEPEAGGAREEEIPAAVVVKGGEAVPAALPEKTEAPRTQEAASPRNQAEEETPPLPSQASPVSLPRPATVEAKPAPKAPSYQPKPVVPYVIVQKGETLGEILQRELGSAHKYMDLVLQFNEGMDPDHLRAGQKIWLPPNLNALRTRTAQDRASAPPVKKTRPAPASRTYKVKKGDSLWKIATRFFGKKRVLEGIRRIKQANPDKDLDLLPAGMVLVVPR